VLNYNGIIKNISPSASMKRGLGAKSDTLINFAIGMPDILPPKEVQEILASRSEVNRYPYTATTGTDLARKNLAHLLSNQHLELHPDEVIACDGAKFGIFLALKTVTNPGDRVMVLEPYWLSYPHILTALGLIQESFVPEINSDGLLSYDYDDLVRKVKENNVKVLVLNNPNNPSGQIIPLEVIRKIAFELNELGIWLILDEVYIELVFDPEKRSATSVRSENLIRIGSFSKSLCIPGLRAGYMVASPQVLKNILLLMQHTQTCINSFALSVLEGISKETLLAHSRMCGRIYEKRFDTLSSLFKVRNIPLLEIESSFYAFADFSTYFENSEDSCDFLTDKLGIITTPGHEYGSFFKSYVRICLTQSSEIIESAFNPLSDAIV
jgi:aspartate/methionine/tyrosine aminotransferase